MKKDRIDTASGSANSFQRAIEGVNIPKHLYLPDSVKPFLEPILRCRAYSDWNLSDITKAVNLARTQAKIEQISQELELEGDVIRNERGTYVQNPKHALLETLTRRDIALSRAIHVHAEATAGRSRDNGNRAKKQGAQLASIDQARDKASGLIPGV